MTTAGPTSILPILEMAVIIALAFSSGLSFCLSTWVVPIIREADIRTQIVQFNKAVNQGARYLQPSSRILGLALLSTMFLMSRLPDEEQASRWCHYAVMLAILVPIAPYEIYLIFPINDRIARIGKEIKEEGSRDAAGKAQKLDRLLSQWQLRNFGRVTPPLVASIIGIASLAQVL